MVRFNSDDLGPSALADGIAKVIRDLEAYERDRLPQLPEELRTRRQRQLDEARENVAGAAGVLARWIADDALRGY